MAIALSVFEVLAVRKLPARNRLNVLAAASTANIMLGSDPLAIAATAVAKHIVVIGLPEAKLPSAHLFWRELGRGFTHVLPGNADA